MKAIVYTKYGPPEVLQLKEVEKPVPNDNEVLIKIYATTVTSGDCRMRKADPFAVRFFNGLTRPKKITILGNELAGEIEAVGKDVKLFRTGDQVFGQAGLSLGANAEYICQPEDGTLAIKPANITYDIIFDTIGKSPFSGCVKSLKQKGVYLRAVHMSLSPVVRGLWTSMTSSKKVIGGIATERKENLVFLKELIEAGKLKPVIDRRYPFEQTAEAHRYVDKGHKKGNVVITVRRQ